MLHLHQMKKFIHILIAGLFLFTTTGFTITKHYCGGNLVDVAINATPEACCDVNEGGCCTDESETFQLKENVTPVQSIDLDQEFSFDIQILVNDLFEVNLPQISESNSCFEINIPPPDVTAFLADIQSFRL